MIHFQLPNVHCKLRSDSWDVAVASEADSSAKDALRKMWQRQGEVHAEPHVRIWFTWGYCLRNMLPRAMHADMTTLLCYILHCCCHSRATPFGCHRLLRR